MTEGESHGSKTWRRSVFAVAMLGLFIVFFELNGYRTLTKHEGFVAVVSQEMLTSGDMVVPRFGGLPRLKKPPLAYWCAATASWIVGEHAPWTARLPSALSGLVLATLVGFWAGNWYGRWSGLAAAVVQLTCVNFIDFSRKAEVDMLLCLLTTMALYLVAHGSPNENRKSRFIRWSAIYALVGLAWLAKFHYGPAMVFGVVVSWFLTQRRWPTVWDVLNPLGIALLLVAVFVWPWMLLQRIPDAWEIWQSETVGRALGEFGRAPFWYYVPHIAVQTLPWSLLLGYAVKESYRRAWHESDERERFLWIWFMTQFAILSASAFKHHHYLMACLPALVLILGRKVANICQQLQCGHIRLSALQIRGIVIGLLATGILGALGISFEWPHLKIPAMILGIDLAITGVIVGRCMSKRRWASSIVGLTAGLAICYVIVNGFVFPNRDRRIPYIEFVENVRQVIPSSQPICIYALQEDPITYYLAGPKFRAETIDDLNREINRRGGLVLISAPPHLAELNLPGYDLEVTDVPEVNGRQPPLQLARLLPHSLATSESVVATQR